MLEKNRLQPPPCFEAFEAKCRVPESARVTATVSGDALGFVSAEDFDCTGILAGIDPCASNYWWMPELHGPNVSGSPAEPAVSAAGTGPVKAAAGLLESALRGPAHATQRTASRTTAAA
jgi:hypothetical protein